MAATTIPCFSSLLDLKSKLSFVAQKSSIGAKKCHIYTVIQTVKETCTVENAQAIAKIDGECPHTSLKSFQVVRSGNPSARHRRLYIRRQKSLAEATADRKKMFSVPNKWRQPACIGTEGLQNYIPEHMKDILNQELRSHDDVIYLSQKVRVGVHLQDCKRRLQEELGYEASYIQWAAYMALSPKELAMRLFESSRAMEKLVRSNKWVVISVARKYENMGIEMVDLIQEGSTGLVHGLKKFDYTKGIKISTYVYWWIRQMRERIPKGSSSQTLRRLRLHDFLRIVIFLTKNSRTIRLSFYMHELLSSIRKAKLLLKDEGASPSITRIAMTLNISDAKVKKGIKAEKRLISLDRETHRNSSSLAQTYIMDSNLKNQPWVHAENENLKEEINNLINSTLTTRERTIFRLYFGLDTCGYTWEAIGKLLGLSRETARQVGLEAIQKFKHAAIYQKLEPLTILQME